MSDLSNLPHAETKPVFYSTDPIHEEHLEFVALCGEIQTFNAEQDFAYSTDALAPQLERIVTKHGYQQSIAELAELRLSVEQYSDDPHSVTTQMALEGIKAMAEDFRNKLLAILKKLWDFVTGLFRKGTGQMEKERAKAKDTAERTRKVRSNAAKIKASSVRLCPMDLWKATVEHLLKIGKEAEKIKPYTSGDFLHRLHQSVVKKSTDQKVFSMDEPMKYMAEMSDGLNEALTGARKASAPLRDSGWNPSSHSQLLGKVNELWSVYSQKIAPLIHDYTKALKDTNLMIKAIKQIDSIDNPGDYSRPVSVIQLEKYTTFLRKLLMSLTSYVRLSVVLIRFYNHAGAAILHTAETD